MAAPTARDAIFQNNLSPEEHNKKDNRVHRSRSRTGIQSGADMEPLIEFTKRQLPPLELSPIDLQSPIDGHQVGETLDLSSKGAKAVPLDVIDWIKDRVERLALSHNPQISIPTEISLCSRLLYLNLRWNNFTEFPEAILLLPQLQTLDLSRNQISIIPDDIKRMTSLKFFAFTHNQVSELPLCMGEMASLTKLKLDDNPIAYPPMEEYSPTPDQRLRPGFDGNTYVCGQVKLFMRRERERQRYEMESDMSESNLETPRPLKRSNTGRFPVRPSGSSDVSEPLGFTETRSITDPRGYVAPPIPQKSVARDSLTVPHVRRPGLAPLSMTGISNRSRSETVAAGTQRFKRHGFVPSRKISGPPSAALQANDLNADFDQHNRTASQGINSTYANVMSPGTRSPMDTLNNRPWTSSKSSRLSSLPEDRRVSKLTNPTIRSAQLLVYSLEQLNRPVDDVIRIIRGESSRMSTAERLHVNAAQNLKELDAQLHILTPMSENQAQESKEVRLILKRSRYCVQAYHQLVSELRLNAKKLIVRGDPMYVRTLMMRLYSCLLEVQNACNIQDQTLAQSLHSRYSTASQARSDRTVTPTLSKPSNRRLRGAKIISGMRDDPSPTPSTYAPTTIPAVLHRTPLFNSTIMTPRSAEAFVGQPIASTTVTSNGTPADSDEERQFEKIYLALKQVCDFADQTLISCRQDFFVRKEGALRSMSNSAARAWNLALTKCDLLIPALDLLKKRLARVRLNDPANRRSREFWTICDSVFNAWYDLASEIKALGAQEGLDIGSIKPMLRPVQKAIKEASHLVNTSTLAKTSADNYVGPVLQQLNLSPTPLSAALGPAVQATVPNTPNTATIVSPSDQYYGYRYDKDRYDKERGEHRERSDTVTSRYATSVRVRS